MIEIALVRLGGEKHLLKATAGDSARMLEIKERLLLEGTMVVPRVSRP